jgi:hypothetical protein
MMGDVVVHDEWSGYPERSYKCLRCTARHLYRRRYEDIPAKCSLCQGEITRDYRADGAPRCQVTTPIRDVRFKLEKEEREGKRPRAIERDMDPHIATV